MNEEWSENGEGRKKGGKKMNGRGAGRRRKKERCRQKE